MSKESESYRLEMLRRFEKISGGPPPAEVLEAEKVVAKFRDEQAKAREVVNRASLALPHKNSCPQCYYLHGRESLMRAAEHTDARQFDLLKCGACGYEQERKTGL